MIQGTNEPSAPNRATRIAKPTVILSLSGMQQLSMDDLPYFEAESGEREIVLVLIGIFFVAAPPSLITRHSALAMPTPSK